MNKKAAAEFDFDSYGMGFLARHLHRLRVIISEQSDEVFVEMGVSVPSHCASLMLFLDECGGAPVMKTAEALGYSHQLVNQRIGILEKHECAAKYIDPDDRRRSLVRLTAAGRKQTRLVRKAMPLIDIGLRDALAPHDKKMQQHLIDVRESLLDSSLRIRARSG